MYGDYKPSEEVQSLIDEAAGIASEMDKLAAKRAGVLARLPVRYAVARRLPSGTDTVLCRASWVSPFGEGFFGPDHEDVATFTLPSRAIKEIERCQDKWPGNYRVVEVPKK
jgi:hypothetical protein